MVTSLLAQITAFLNLNCNKISKIAQQESTDQFESMICTWPWIEAEREMLVGQVSCLGAAVWRTIGGFAVLGDLDLVGLEVGADR